MWSDARSQRKNVASARRAEKRLKRVKNKVNGNFPVKTESIGVRAGGARGAAPPPKFGQLRFFGQQEKIWAKLLLKDVSMFFIIIIILKR